MMVLDYFYVGFSAFQNTIINYENFKDILEIMNFF